MDGPRLSAARREFPRLPTSREPGPEEVTHLPPPLHGASGKAVGVPCQHHPVVHRVVTVRGLHGLECQPLDERHLIEEPFLQFPHPAFDVLPGPTPFDLGEPVGPAEPPACRIFPVAVLAIDLEALRQREGAGVDGHPRALARIVEGEVGNRADLRRKPIPGLDHLGVGALLDGDRTHTLHHAGLDRVQEGPHVPGEVPVVHHGALDHLRIVGTSCSPVGDQQVLGDVVLGLGRDRCAVPTVQV